MKAYDLLSRPIKKFLRDQRWESLRPIQQVAITKITQTDYHYILAARTASGKTEAAFLPILSQVNFQESGVQVLYISPLIALINDQFERIHQLCRHLDVRITKWHGEANPSAKKKLVQQPNGVVLITPESIEAMFANRPFYIDALFSNLKYIVIDEIHSFLGTDRGLQLKSLLHRIQARTQQPVRFVALSATLGDYYTDAKAFFGEPEKTKILRDTTAQPIEAVIQYHEMDKADLPLELLKLLYKKTQEKKALIFPNSRGRVEEITFKLKRIAQIRGGHAHYFSHHSSVNKELREFIEFFAKSNQQKNFAIACTSTLELGIDIGSVDIVIQIDTTFSVASLAQRLGRSGRKKGQKSNLLLCATNQWNLLQAVACFQLLKEGFIEPLKNNLYPIDILLHQILSILKEHNGISKQTLLNKIRANYTFVTIPNKDIDDLIQDLLSKKYIESTSNQYILGVDAEPIVNSRDFYTVFQTPQFYKVINKNKVIGEIPPTPQIIPDENILLAGKVWKIKEISYQASKIYVEKATTGNKPLFFGNGGHIHARIRQKMLDIILGTLLPAACDRSVREEIEEIRGIFKDLKLSDAHQQRPVYCHEQKVEFYTFTSSKINNTLIFLFKNHFDQPVKLYDHNSQIIMDIDFEVFKAGISEIVENIQEIANTILTHLENDDSGLPLSKWGAYLPTTLKHKLILLTHFDIEGTASFLLALKLKKI